MARPAQPSNRRDSNRARLRRCGWIALVALAPACQPEIGDPCILARDCSIRGERQCDLSYAGPKPNGGERQGECTIENCSFGSCPDEAVCIKVYGSDFLTVACDPDLEDVYVECTGDTAETVAACDGNEGGVVLVNDCEPNETCIPEGLCADEISARTSCRRECNTDGDCRSAYECKRVGSNGVYVSPKPKNPTKVRTAKICVPRGL